MVTERSGQKSFTNAKPVLAITEPWAYKSRMQAGGDSGTRLCLFSWEDKFIIYVRTIEHTYGKFEGKRYSEKMRRILEWRASHPSASYLAISDNPEQQAKNMKEWAAKLKSSVLDGRLFNNPAALEIRMAADDYTLLFATEIVLANSYTQQKVYGVLEKYNLITK